MTRMFFLLAAFIIIVRCICIAAHFSRKDFAGHRLRFYTLAFSYVFSGGGALAMALGNEYGAHLLLAGMAGFFVAERRLP